MLNLSNIDLSKEYRTTEDEIRSAKSYIYQLVEELDFRLGQIYETGDMGGGSSMPLPANGKDGSPLVCSEDGIRWSGIGYLSEHEYLVLAEELAEPYDADADYFIGEFCSYGGSVWECNTEISGEDWDPSHWNEVGTP